MDVVALELSRLKIAAETALLLSGLVSLLSGVGWLAAGPLGLMFGPVGLGAVMLLQSGEVDRLLRHHRVRAVHPHSRPARLFRALQQRSGLQNVSLFAAPSGQLNAFAVGDRSEAAVVVTLPLLQRFADDELAGILGHELTPIANGDVRVMGTATILTRAIIQTGVFAVLLTVLAPQTQVAPVAVALAALAAAVLGALMTAKLSRTREFAADLGSARLLGNPAPLARALLRLEGYARRLTPWWLRPRRQRRSLHDSHPATTERLARLDSYLGA